MVSILQLKYLVTIAEEGSFIRAAERLSVTQPALTSQILNLEDDLGVMLIDRTTKPVKPTEIGKQIIEQASMVLQETAKIRDMAATLSMQMSGQLSLGIIPTVSPYLVPLFAKNFAKHFKETSLEVKEMLTEEVIHKVKSGQVDAGIISTPVNVKNLVFIPLYDERIFLYCSNYHPFFGMPEVPVEEINNYDIWFLREGNCFRNQTVNLCSSAEREKKQFSYESNSIDSLIKIVDAQEGVTFIPELASRQLSDRKKEQLRTIKGVKPGRQISLIVTKAFLKKRLIKQTVDIIKESMPKDMAAENDLELLNTNISL